MSQRSDEKSTEKVIRGVTWTYKDYEKTDGKFDATGLLCLSNERKDLFEFIKAISESIEKNKKE